jgi:hypothetical protein
MEGIWSILVEPERSARVAGRGFFRFGEQAVGAFVEFSECSASQRD